MTEVGNELPSDDKLSVRCLYSAVNQVDSFT